MAADRVAIVPLDGSNYSTWKLQCKNVLMGQNLWRIVTGDENPPSVVEEMPKFNQRRDKALSLIVLAVHPSLLYLIGDPTQPSDVWKKLENHFQRSSWANQFTLRKRLYSLKLCNDGNLENHLRETTELFDNLSAVGDELKEKDRVMVLLSSLPPRFDVLVTALQSSSEMPSMERVMETLKAEDARQCDREVGETLFMSKNKPFQISNDGKVNFDKRKLICYYCKSPGHIKRECRRWKASQKSFVVDEAEDESAGFIVSQINLGTTDPGKCSEFILDSGATSHITNSEKLLRNITTVSSPIKVALGNNKIVHAVAKGDILLDVRLPGGIGNLMLFDVLYVPDIAFNLISISKACANNYSVVFTEGSGIISNDRNELVATADKINNLFYLNGSPVINEIANASVASKENLWHRRFCHLNEGYLKFMKNSDLVHNFDYNVKNKLPMCKDCKLNKSHRDKFSRDVNHRSLSPLEIIHSDLCGPMEVGSLGGARYFLTFTDDFSGFSWIYFLKYKSDAFNRFVKFKNMIENELDAKIKNLRSDNGGEYVSKQFSDFLESNGIKRQLTMAKTPQQNAISERLNRTLLESCRTMLKDACLPKKFWAEAMNTAIYIRNRTYRKISDKTPYEIIRNKKPDVGKFRVFGCRSYCHIPKDERSKLDSTAILCMFLGYCTNRSGYRLYDFNKAKIVFSRDVIFDESIVGIPILDQTSSEPITFNDFKINEIASVPDNNLNDVAESDSESNINVQSREVIAESRYPTRVRKAPDFYGERTSFVSDNFEPKSFDQAVNCRDSQQWIDAMKTELDNLKRNNVFDLVDLPEGKNLIKSKLVYKIKPDKYKARLVAQGFSQVWGVDYNETFSPVIKFKSIRTLLALSAKLNLSVHHMDVTCAFLNGKLEEEIYVSQPEGFVEKGKENLVCKLNRSLYGLK